MSKRISAGIRRPRTDKQARALAGLPLRGKTFAPGAPSASAWSSDQTNGVPKVFQREREGRGKGWHWHWRRKDLHDALKCPAIGSDLERCDGCTKTVAVPRVQGTVLRQIVGQEKPEFGFEGCSRLDAGRLQRIHRRKFRSHDNELECYDGSPVAALSAILSGCHCLERRANAFRCNDLRRCETTRFQHCGALLAAGFRDRRLPGIRAPRH